MVFDDAPHKGEPRCPVTWRPGEGNKSAEYEFVADVQLTREVRPGAYTIRDYNFRHPAFPLFVGTPPVDGPERSYEQYHYQPGACLIETNEPSDTPFADADAVARHVTSHGADGATRALEARRADQCRVSYETNVAELQPGAVFSIAQHPHDDLDGALLLVTELELQGTWEQEWTIRGSAVFTQQPFRPSREVPKPQVAGVQSATVVGPKGQEIHTDEFGRVKVQFPWDREGQSDAHSSCWLRVSQGWAGTSFGAILIPRIGDEVLVGFLAGDPDQPIIVGRVFNATQCVPYALPDHKTRSTWKSRSSPNSSGFNEILFEDLAGQELVYLQAEKNLRKLVKHDETITIGRDQQKLVKHDELEVTRGTRTELTHQRRTEITDGNRLTLIRGNATRRVEGREITRVESEYRGWVGEDQHLTTLGSQRVRVEGDSHCRVEGSHYERVEGVYSRRVKSQQTQVETGYALEAGAEIHLHAAGKLVFESAKELTFKAPGGFVKIDRSGVTIVGSLVKLNSGGSPGSAEPAETVAPEAPLVAEIERPQRPEIDDVSRTRLGQ